MGIWLTLWWGKLKGSALGNEWKYAYRGDKGFLCILMRLEENLAHLELVTDDALLGIWTKESHFSQVGLVCPELERHIGGGGIVAAREKLWSRIMTIAK